MGERSSRRMGQRIDEFLVAENGAQHCSSLCSQSEGGEYCGGQARLKIQQSHAPERWVFKIQKNLCAVLSQIAWRCAAAPERGSYSRIGACPYLSPVLIDSRFCPCKGRISLAGLAPQ